MSWLRTGFLKKPALEFGLFKLLIRCGRPRILAFASGLARQAGGFSRPFFACSGAKQQGELIECLGIIFAPPADIAYPGGEVRCADQLLAHPGKVSHRGLMHLPHAAFAARNLNGGFADSLQINSLRISNI